MSAIIIEEVDQDSVRFIFTNGSLAVLVRHGDLSCEPCDAIVNSTNSALVPDGGLDAKIHESMGQFFTDQAVAIHKDMNEQSCPIGQSRIFIAKFHRTEYDPRFVISTAGPIYVESEKEQARFLLQSCYYTSLALANIYQLGSIAYPAIACGANHFPPNEAAQVAIDSVRRFSFNVKDVRFVLYERSLFDIFVQEWTNYAQEINKEASSADIISSNMTESSTKEVENPKAPLSSKPSSLYCTLCENQQLSGNQNILCSNCSQMARAQVFRNILAKLRQASEKSYGDLANECQSLKPILTLYPLICTPAQVFNPQCHSRDSVAEYYLQNHCDKAFRNCIPMAIVGDGNCLYNTFVALAGQNATTDGSLLTPIELRARNIIELVPNVDRYRTQYDHMSPILDDFEDYVRQEMVNDTNFAAVWDLLSIPTVLNIDVTSVYPSVNGPQDTHKIFLNNVLFYPLPENHTDNDPQSTSGKPAARNHVIILFSNANKPHPKMKKNDVAWIPNHFVPLLRCP